MSEGQDALLAEARDYLQSICPASTGHDINAALNKFADGSDLQGKEFALALQTHIQRKVLAELRCKPGEPGLRESVFPDKRLVQVPEPVEVAGETITHNYYGGGDVGRGRDVEKRFDDLLRLLANRQRNDNAGAAGANNTNNAPPRPLGAGPRDTDQYHDTRAFIVGGGRRLNGSEVNRVIGDIRKLKAGWDSDKGTIRREIDALEHFAERHLLDVMDANDDPISELREEFEAYTAPGHEAAARLYKDLGAMNDKARENTALLAKLRNDFYRYPEAIQNTAPMQSFLHDIQRRYKQQMSKRVDELRSKPRKEQLERLEEMSSTYSDQGTDEIIQRRIQTLNDELGEEMDTGGDPGPSVRLTAREQRELQRAQNSRDIYGQKWEQAQWNAELKLAQSRADAQRKREEAQRAEELKRHVLEAQTERKEIERQLEQRRTLQKLLSEAQLRTQKAQLQLQAQPRPQLAAAIAVPLPNAAANAGPSLTPAQNQQPQGQAPQMPYIPAQNQQPAPNLSNIPAQNQQPGPNLSNIPAQNQQPAPNLSNTPAQAQANANVPVSNAVPRVNATPVNANVPVSASNQQTIIDAAILAANRAQAQATGQPLPNAAPSTQNQQQQSAAGQQTQAGPRLAEMFQEVRDLIGSEEQQGPSSQPRSNQGGQQQQGSPAAPTPTTAPPLQGQEPQAQTKAAAAAANASLVDAQVQAQAQARAQAQADARAQADEAQRQAQAQSGNVGGSQPVTGQQQPGQSQTTGQPAQPQTQSENTSAGVSPEKARQFREELDAISHLAPDDDGTLSHEQLIDVQQQLVKLLQQSPPESQAAADLRKAQTILSSMIRNALQPGQQQQQPAGPQHQQNVQQPTDQQPPPQSNTGPSGFQRPQQPSQPNTAPQQQQQAQQDPQSHAPDAPGPSSIPFVRQAAAGEGADVRDADDVQRTGAGSPEEEAQIMAALRGREQFEPYPDDDDRPRVSLRDTARYDDIDMSPEERAVIDSILRSEGRAMRGRRPRADTDTSSDDSDQPPRQRLRLAIVSALARRQPSLNNPSISSTDTEESQGRPRQRPRRDESPAPTLAQAGIAAAELAAAARSDEREEAERVIAQYEQHIDLNEYSGRNRQLVLEFISDLKPGDTAFLTQKGATAQEIRRMLARGPRTREERKVTRQRVDEILGLSSSAETNSTIVSDETRGTDSMPSYSTDSTDSREDERARAYEAGRVVEDTGPAGLNDNPARDDTMRQRLENIRKAMEDDVEAGRRTRATVLNALELPNVEDAELALELPNVEDAELALELAQERSKRAKAVLARFRQNQTRLDGRVQKRRNANDLVARVAGRRTQRGRAPNQSDIAVEEVSEEPDGSRPENERLAEAEQEKMLAEEAEKQARREAKRRRQEENEARTKAYKARYDERRRDGLRLADFNKRSEARETQSQPARGDLLPQGRRKRGLVSARAPPPPYVNPVIEEPKRLRFRQAILHRNADLEDLVDIIVEAVMATPALAEHRVEDGPF